MAPDARSDDAAEPAATQAVPFNPFEPADTGTQAATSEDFPAADTTAATTSPDLPALPSPRGRASPSRAAASWSPSAAQRACTTADSAVN